MHKPCGLRLVPNFRVRPLADKNFYLRLTTEKMRSSAIFNYKYYWSCACSKCTITFRFKNLKNETKTEIIHIQIVHKEI